MRTIQAFFVLVCALCAAGMPLAAFAEERSPNAPEQSPFGTIQPLGWEACAAVTGGDVRMRLNPERNELVVNVIDNEYEARLGRIPPKEVLVFEVHNRVVATQSAPFYPASREGRMLASQGELGTRPAQFPEGYWSITTVRERNDRYGPYFIGTNAVGLVEVYRKADNGAMLFEGVYPDTGYALHANSKPFNVSKSYGCIILKQEDVAKLAQVLIRDREENPAAVQKIYVPSRSLMEMR
ncbi:MAG: L,D-transpeptidase [Rectinemataceae bacterium]|nr:L,D-transpeptidase [Spirochaetaceae bacterium]